MSQQSVGFQSCSPGTNIDNPQTGATRTGYRAGTGFRKGCMCGNLSHLNDFHIAPVGSGHRSGKRKRILYILSPHSAVSRSKWSGVRTVMWRILILVALSTWMLMGCSTGNQQAATVSIGRATLTDRPVDDMRMLALINAHRAAHGLAPVHLDPQLKQAAQDMARRTAKAGKLRIREHSPSSLSRRVMATGYPYLAGAENLVRGRADEDAAFQAWRHSAGHNKNMLWPWLTEIGLARTDSGRDGKPYWALILGLPEKDGQLLEAGYRAGTLPQH